MNNEFEIVSVNISTKKGVVKYPVPEINLIEDFGIENDAHAGKWHRQISLLASEDIETMQNKGLELHPGDFAENITTLGIKLDSLPIGTKLSINNAIIEITQIGKKCHHDCEIFKTIGDCVMPKKGIFAKVIKAGKISNKAKGYLIS